MAEVSGPNVAAQRAFRPEPMSAKAARDFVTSAVPGAGETVHSVLSLLTSELVTNAVLHARTDILVTALNMNGRLRVEVADDNPRLPHQPVVPTDATSGRGLSLVDGMAVAWGVTPTSQGKSVWFEVVMPTP